MKQQLQHDSSVFATHADTGCAKTEHAHAGGQVGSGYGDNQGSGYGSNTGTGHQTTAEKAKSYIPGTEENKASKAQTGSGTGYGSSGQDTGYGSGTGTGNALSQCGFVLLLV